MTYLETQYKVACKIAAQKCFAATTAFCFFFRKCSLLSNV